MFDHEIRILGLKARAFKLSRKGKDRPSNDLLYLWFVERAQLVKKRDVQLFDVWLRSEDGVTPYPTPNGLQHSIFPPGVTPARKPTPPTSLDWLVHQAAPLQWAVTVGGYLELKKKADKLPSSDL